MRRDVVLAVSLLAAAEAELALSPDSVEGASRMAVALCLPLVTLPIALRRRAPLTMAGAFAVLGAGPALAGVPTDLVTALLVVLIASFSAGAELPTRRAVLALVLLVLPLLLGAADDHVFIVVLTAAPWFAGRLVRERGRQAQRIAALAADNERLAVESERLRIGRELHDSVAHAMSVMVVQAAAAEGVLATDPERARAPLASIQHEGRRAVAELRRMLGLLRDGSARELLPPPGLGQLPDLVAEARRAGLSVELSTEGEPGPLPAGLDLSAYRIVQEALTNVRKHAAGARARVRVRWHPDALELEIVDSGGTGDATASPGHGLVGMRERAALFGGHLEAAPRNGGFAVRAVIPR